MVGIYSADISCFRREWDTKGMWTSGLPQRSRKEERPLRAGDSSEKNSSGFCLSRLVITFLPRNKCLLISWLQSQSAVVLELKKIKSVTVSIVSPSICHEVMGPDAMI